MPTIIPETKLPNGTQIFCLQDEEVPLLYEQVQDYVKYGIELHEEDVVFDVGANIGLFSWWAYQQCDKNVSIYAFAPICAIFEVLQANANRFDAEKILEDRLQKITALLKKRGFTEIEVVQETMFRSSNLFNLYA